MIRFDSCMEMDACERELLNTARSNNFKQEKK